MQAYTRERSIEQTNKQTNPRSIYRSIEAKNHNYAGVYILPVIKRKHTLLYLVVLSKHDNVLNAKNKYIGLFNVLNSLLLATKINLV